MKKLILLFSIVIIAGTTQTKAQGTQWWSQANQQWINTSDSLFHAGQGITEQFFAPFPISIISVKSGVSLNNDTSNAWIQKLINANMATSNWQALIRQAIDSVISVGATSAIQNAIHWAIDSVITYTSNPYYSPHQDSATVYLTNAATTIERDIGGKYAFTTCTIFDSASYDTVEAYRFTSGVWIPVPMINCSTGSPDNTANLMVPAVGQYTTYKPSGIYYINSIKFVLKNYNTVGNVWFHTKSVQ